MQLPGPHPGLQSQQLLLRHAPHIVPYSIALLMLLLSHHDKVSPRKKYNKPQNISYTFKRLHVLDMYEFQVQGSCIKMRVVFQRTRFFFYAEKTDCVFVFMLEM